MGKPIAPLKTNRSQNMAKLSFSRPIIKPANTELIAEFKDHELKLTLMVLGAANSSVFLSIDYVNALYEALMNGQDTRFQLSEYQALQLTRIDNDMIVDIFNGHSDMHTALTADQTILLAKMIKDDIATILVS
jgi:hypothetical protein